MRLKNTSGGRIEQVFEGKRYIWEGDGDVMTLPDGLGAWMLGKLNSPDSNPDLKAKRQETGKSDLMFLAMLPAKKGDQVADLNVVRAEKAAKPADPAPAAK
jgi:hypothetical protein